jgi:hypothetical protein
VDNQIDRESPSPVPTELVLSDDEDDDEHHLTEEKSESPKGTLKVRDQVSAGYCYYDNERLIRITYCHAASRADWLTLWR